MPNPNNAPREFLVQCDVPNGEERGRFCVISVNPGKLLERKALLLHSMAVDPGLKSMAFAGYGTFQSFRLLFLDSDFPVSNDGLDAEPEYLRCPLSDSVQGEFEGHRVAEVPLGTEDAISRDMAGFLTEWEVEDDRIVLDVVGFHGMTTVDDGETVIRTWTVTWDTFGKDV